MASKIQVRRGFKQDLPILDSGEFGLAQDTQEVFMGLGNENLEVVNKKKLNNSIGVNLKDFGVKGDGVTDDTLAIQAAIDDVYANGGGIINLGKGVYKYTSISLFPGVFLKGLNMPTDGNMRSNRKDMPTVLYPTSTTSPSIIMYGGSGIKGVCWDYKDQKRTLATETEAFIVYPATIQLGTDVEPAIGNYIGDFLVLGAYDFLVQGSYAKSAEKLLVENGYGMVLNTFAHIKRSADVPRFNNIHMNLNTIAFNWLTGDTVPYYTKIAKNAVAFKMSRVDDILITNSFFYGMKHLVHSVVDSDVSDTGTGGGATLIGTSIDVCHQAFRIERSTFSMGIKVTGGFFTPVVGIAGSDQALVWFGSSAQYTRVVMDNVRMFGSAVPQVTGSKPTDYAVVYDATTGINNPVTIVGELDQYVTGLVKNEDKVNYNSLQLIGKDKGVPYVSSYRANVDILTLLSSRVYLNHPTNDKVMFRVNGLTSANDSFFTQFDATGALLASQRYLQAGTVTALPTASSQYRGRMVRVEGAAGVADSLYVCMKSATDTYSWKPVVTG